MDLNLIIGVAGAAIVLIAFLLNESGKLNSEDFQYDLLNLIGSILLLIYAFNLNSLPFIIVNLIWGGFSLKDVIKYLATRNKK